MFIPWWEIPAASWLGSNYCFEFAQSTNVVEQSFGWCPLVSHQQEEQVGCKYSFVLRLFLHPRVLCPLRDHCVISEDSVQKQHLPRAFSSPSHLYKNLVSITGKTSCLIDTLCLLQFKSITFPEHSLTPPIYIKTSCLLLEMIFNNGKYLLSTSLNTFMCQALCFLFNPYKNLMRKTLLPCLFY